MQENKKLNLLPNALKNKYLNRTLAYGAGVVCGLYLLAFLFLYGNIGILSMSINSLKQENTAYNTEKEKMELLQSSIAAHKTLLDSFEQANFPFARFMSDLDYNRPFGVSIFSIDSADRLIQMDEEKKNTESENTETEKPPETEPEDGQEAPAAEDVPAHPQIEYVKDLNGEKIVIRGYSDSQEAISQFIYDISKLDYIADTQVTAIEQHKMENVPVNIFELVVTGGAKH